LPVLPIVFFISLNNKVFQQSLHMLKRLHIVEIAH
jgi:hypothetical protein